VVLYIFGSATPANIADSDRVCSALQVFEHCQDVGEDARAGRIYLPAADLRQAGVAEDDVLAGTTSPALAEVIGQQVQRSRALLADARPLVGRLSGWARLAVAGFAGGGYATADALDQAGWTVLERDVRPSKARTVSHALRLWAGR
jgi:phytoene synthase